MIETKGMVKIPEKIIHEIILSVEPGASNNMGDIMAPIKAKSNKGMLANHMSI